ncbi:MAG: hypothetical protein KDG55_16120 [Rhodocyclaceae bacterium]|nr:hypothetical protein [Rhodocyclaceae bacterium]
MKRMLATVLVGLAPTVVAHAACQNVTGSVLLVPDGACQVQTQITDAAFDTSQCFSVTLSIFGLPIGRGYAGVTNEVAVDEDLNLSVTPLNLIEGGATPTVRNQIQTARSAIVVGSGLFKTTLYSTDVVVIRPQGPGGAPVVTEQVVLSGTDGKGLFRNTTGSLVVLGNSIGQSAPVAGQLCF